MFQPEFAVPLSDDIGLKWEERFRAFLHPARFVSVTEGKRNREIFVYLLT